MPLQISCPSCGAKINVPEPGTGKKAKCPNCQQPVQNPDEADNRLLACALEELKEPSATPAQPARSSPEPSRQRAKPDLTVTCSQCEAVMPVSSWEGRQVVRCPNCHAPMKLSVTDGVVIAVAASRVEVLKASGAAIPISETRPVSETRTRDSAMGRAERKKDDEDEPWYYGWTRLFACLLAIIGILITVVSFARDVTIGLEEHQPNYLPAIRHLVVGLFLSLAVPALLLIFADIGRTLRQIRDKK